MIEQFYSAYRRYPNGHKHSGLEWNWVVMVMKGYSIYPNSSGLEPH